MTRLISTAAAMAALALSACEQGKPRHPPPDPMALTPAAAEPAAPTAGLSVGLTRRSEPPGFFLDHVGQAVDPRGRPPAVTAADAPLQLDGFGFDPVAKLPAKGVDVVVDGKTYGTRYGAARQDVANYFKTPALVNVGFTTTLPAGNLSVGAHVVVVRVISADGRGYFDSPEIAFQTK
ncbi:hypothetical protein [Phenylobacterium sp.]|uniref:hypothetical protein n=1 Tax=Phenylobacterium sp. TaxID=1871053 RepID=UPI00120C528D|nr:hypothetical protein [Phenylobacterium sp.]THD53516.1 MAG: hypothetical protein E8A12_18490 [Phenylobacterium sp.]